MKMCFDHTVHKPNNIRKPNKINPMLVQAEKDNIEFFKMFKFFVNFLTLPNTQATPELCG